MFVGDSSWQSIAFDGLAYLKRLKAVGVPEAQAETFIKIIEGRLTTRLDLKKGESVLRKDLKQIRYDSAKEYAKTKFEIIRWTAVMLVAQAAIAGHPG
ncbi:MAG: hypothetical protein J7K30_00815 [Deltaproteobacteria bacterium]|nr:hypothetical protein [Deltaproteobacteria bacterium]